MTTNTNINAADIKTSIKTRIAAIDERIAETTDAATLSTLNDARERIANVKIVNHTCRVCGRAVAQFACKAGRNKDVHNECREFEAAQVRLAALAQKITFADNDKGRDNLRRVRGDVLCMLNQSLHKNTANFADAADADERIERKGATVASVVIADDAAADEFFASVDAELDATVETTSDIDDAVPTVDMLDDVTVAVIDAEGYAAACNIEVDRIGGVNPDDDFDINNDFVGNIEALMASRAKNGGAYVNGYRLVVWGWRTDGDFDCAARFINIINGDGTTRTADEIGRDAAEFINRF